MAHTVDKLALEQYDRLDCINGPQTPYHSVPTPFALQIGRSILPFSSGLRGSCLRQQHVSKCDPPRGGLKKHLHTFPCSLAPL